MTLVGRRPLIDHALERFRATGVGRVTIIINEESDDCRQWLGRNAGDLDLDLVVRTTPSSYASFDIVAGRLAGEPALITTVDSILPIDDFRGFVRSAAAFPKDAVVLGVTTHVDDEKPLWATLDAQGRIRALGGNGGSYVTAGLYWLPAIDLRLGRRTLRGCATICNGSPSARRRMASTCRSSSISTGPATWRRRRRAC